MVSNLRPGLKSQSVVLLSYVEGESTTTVSCFKDILLGAVLLLLVAVLLLVVVSNNSAVPMSCAVKVTFTVAQLYIDNQIFIFYFDKIESK